jgi:N utilization substance protein A
LEKWAAPTFLAVWGGAPVREECKVGMRNDLIMAINQIASGKELPKEVVTEAIEAALVSAYKRDSGSANNVVAKVDLVNGEYRIFIEKNVVEVVTDPKTELTLAEARAVDPNAQVGGKVLIDSTPKNFGRIAAQNAKQVILQRLREAERDSVYQYFAEQENEIVTGTVQSIDYATGNITVNLIRGEGILEKSEQLPTERYRLNSKVRAYLTEVHRGNRGPVVKLSRTHRNMLRRLLEQEIPEIFNGTVEIKSIAREPGYRSKVAVEARQPGVDPVGSCVGMRGTRIQNIVNELNGEKIDVVEWSADTAVFIANALSPAKVSDVILQENDEGKTAIVIVPDRQLSLAIGKEGQNARLAAKLTGWRIDIKSETEAAAEGLDQLARERARAAALAPGADLLAVAEAILREKEAAAAAQFAAAQAAVEAEDKAAREMKPPEEARPVTEVPAVEAPTEVAPSEAETPAPPAGEAAVAAGPEGQQPVEPAVEEQAEVIGEEYYFDEAGGEIVEEEDEGKPRGKKKSSKKRTLVFDERRGEVVAVRRRKPSRSRGWDVEDEEI